MIRPEEIIPAGVFNKTHGIKGELSATFGHDVEPDTLRCLFVDMDGIPVPFFIESSRPRTADTWLVTLDGIDSEEKARLFVGKQFGIHADDLPEPEELDPDADGFYASDLIGFSISDSTLGELGEITDVNDQTENVLFVVTGSDGNEILIPVADEFIDSIDTPARIIHTSIPAEIVDLNR